jgi:hypothetical protein
MLREDLAAAGHISDGGGRAWLKRPPGSSARPFVRAGSRERFEIVYEAGPDGIAEGGVVFLQPSPFWGWDSPQTREPRAGGFTEVSTDADGVTLRPVELAPHLLAINVVNRALASGERIEIVFGAGPAGARVDSYAERDSRLWIAVDGDGDGVRVVLADSPAVDIVAGPAAMMTLVLPTTAHPGDAVRLQLAMLDGLGNAGAPFTGTVRLEATEGLSLPAAVEFAPEHEGQRTVEGTVGRAGVHRVTARADGEIAAESNPLVVNAEATPILWADLHGHSNLSDGTGTPDDYFRYARDVAGLDVVALTDHDHWGIRFIDQNPEMWREIRRATKHFHEPGRFVTVLGYEWTSWLQGHRHVLYFSDEGDIHSSIDPAYSTPTQLWAALKGKPALTFAHHSAGGPVGTNWDFPPDPHFEPVTEIVSVHGSSEAWDTPRRIYNPVKGNFVRDALGRGYRLGFIGSGDSHDGHPGLAQLASPSRNGGLAAILGAERTRASVLEALRQRRVYATSGPRILLRVRLDEHEMGSILNAREISGQTQELDITVVAPEPIDRIDLVRGRAGRAPVVDSIPGEELREWSERRPIAPLVAGEYLYVRAVQIDGAAAWSSPFFAR